MFRKLIVLMCLISLVPAAVSAQGVPMTATSPVAVGSTIEASAPPQRMMDLSLPVERSAAVLMAAADTSKDAIMATAPEKKPEARSSFNWGNFAEVHLGGYRWIWWAGAAVALIAIHAGAD